MNSTLLKALKLPVKGGNKALGLIGKTGTTISAGLNLADEKVMAPLISKLAELLKKAKTGNKTLTKIAGSSDVQEFIKLLRQLNTPGVRKGALGLGMGMGSREIYNNLVNQPDYEMTPYDTGYSPEMGGQDQLSQLLGSQYGSQTY